MMNPIEPLPENHTEFCSEIRGHLESFNLGDMNWEFEPLRDLVDKYATLVQNRLEKEPKINILSKTYSFCINFYLKVHEMKRQPTPVIWYLQSRSNSLKCFESRDAYHQAINFGLQTFEYIGRYIHGKRYNDKRIVQAVSGTRKDREVVRGVVETAFSRFRCEWQHPSNKVTQYKDILSIAKDVKHWISLIENPGERSECNNKLGSQLLDYSLFLIERLSIISPEVAPMICRETIVHYATIPTSFEEMYKIARNLCVSCFSQPPEYFISILNITEVVLDAIAKELKVDQEESHEEFLKLVELCIEYFENVSADDQSKVEESFRRVAKTCISKDNSRLGLILKLDATTFSLGNFNLYKEGIKDIAGNAKPVHHFLTHLESEIKELNSINPITPAFSHSYSNAKRFLRGRLCLLIMSEYKEIIHGFQDDSDGINFDSIHELLYEEINDYHHIGTSEKKQGKDIKLVVNVLGACFILSLITKRNKCIEDLKDLIERQNDVQRHLFTRLPEVSMALYAANNKKKAKESLAIFCQAAWSYVSYFCTTFPSEVNEDVLEDSIVAYVEKACAMSVLLLSMVDKSEMNKTVAEFVRKWVEAQTKFEIPSPVALVEHWVKKLCEATEKPKDLDTPPTLFSLMSSQQSSTESLIILDLELEIYMKEEMKKLNPKLCQKMQNHITELLKETTGNTNWRLERSKKLIRSGTLLRACGVNGRKDCNTYILNAIDIMTHLSENSDCESLMAEAYMIRALCIRDQEPTSKEFLSDIKKALNFWKKPPKANGIGIDILFHTADLLSLEGNMQELSIVNDIIRKHLLSLNYSMEKYIEVIWKHGNLNHPFCVSPIDDTFIDALANDSMLVWTNCLESKHLEVGFKQSLCVIRPLSSCESYDGGGDDDDDAKKIQEAVSTLLKNETDSSTFLAARMYYDLGERLIAKGLLTEALLYAQKSYDWRFRHFKSCFDGSVRSGKIVVSCSKVPASDSSSLLSNTTSMLTPWIVLRYYLESFLQIGMIHNMLGNEADAKRHLLHGKHLASMLHLSLYSFSFSCELGKLYCKKGEWEEAHAELKIAQEQLDGISRSITCKRCNLVFEASLHQQKGDLCFENFKIKTTSNDELIKNAVTAFDTAERLLKDAEWVNDVSHPMEPADWETKFCFATGLPLAIVGSNKNCWHCQPIVKSLSIKNLIDLRFECMRRRLMLRVLSGKGNCHRVQNQIDDEYRVLLQNISVLVSRSMFPKLRFEVAHDFVTTMINQGVTGVDFSIEHASLLYDICCFFLKCFGTTDTCRATISIPTIVSGLKLAYILGCEVPALCQKASRLLSILYVLSPTQDNFMLASPSLSASQWAAYFHQASIGTSLNHSFLSRVNKQSNIEGFTSGSTLSCCLRLPPRQVKSLEMFISEFYRDLPKITIVCLNFVEDEFRILLGRFLPKAKAHTEAWIFLSRLNSVNIPFCILQPLIKLTDEVVKESSGSPDTVISKVAPTFVAILESLKEIMKTKPKDLVHRRKELDERLENFLRRMQHCWLNPWVNLLRGEQSSNTDLDERVKYMKKNLKEICDIDIDEQVLGILTECACGASTGFEFLAETILTRGCYTGVLEMDETRVASICDVIRDSCKEIREVCSREPVILVLDYEAEPLPWESIPAFRGDEVYRMPSVVSIAAALLRCSYNNVGDLKSEPMFPVFNPVKSYYLLNVDGDLDFNISKSCFEDFHIEGKVMTRPPEVELKSALENHDLFIYVAHGHGIQFISGKIIQSMQKCAVAFLMGCGSGRLRLNGSMAPIGAPFYYLLGGSPAIICNLWEVADKDAGAYVKDLVRSCIGYADERDADGRPMKKRKLCQPMNLGSILTKCRDNCFLPYLTGAASICYGVPISIRTEGL